MEIRERQIIVQRISYIEVDCGYLCNFTFL